MNRTTKVAVRLGNNRKKHRHFSITYSQIEIEEGYVGSPIFLLKMKTIAKVPITKNNSSRAREKFTAIGKDFLANTSMHGLKYIGEHERHLFERLFYSYFKSTLCSI